MVSANSVNNLLLRLAASETALLDWLVPHLDEADLREIAALDGCNEEAYFQALKPIYERQPLPIPLTWMPRAVLELGQWSSPDTPQKNITRPRSKGTQGHLIRTFCCAVLLQAADAPETFELLSSESDTLILLIDSVLRLGEEASESALRLLCWRVLRLPEDSEEVPFFALGILLLHVALSAPKQNGSDLSLLADWVVAEETRLRTRSAWTLDDEDSEEWLLGLTYYGFYNEYWRMHSRTILLDPVKKFPKPGAPKMREIAKRLSG